MWGFRPKYYRCRCSRSLFFAIVGPYIPQLVYLPGETIEHGTAYLFRPLIYFCLWGVSRLKPPSWRNKKMYFKFWVVCVHEMTLLFLDFDYGFMACTAIVCGVVVSSKAKVQECVRRNSIRGRASFPVTLFCFSMFMEKTLERWRQVLMFAWLYSRSSLLSVLGICKMGRAEWDEWMLGIVATRFPTTDKILYVHT